jgi:Tol biopolymer transport system component
MRQRVAARRTARFLAASLAALSIALAAGPAAAQFVPYFGKNKVRYDAFQWRIYKAPHFEIYYYPEFERELGRISSYMESAYQQVSSDLKHEIAFAIPVVLYKTSSEFQQTNLFASEVPEGVLAFAEPVRDRMVMPIDLPSDELQDLIIHELTHIFQFDLIPRNLFQRTVPIWVDEGHASYMEGKWDPLDLMQVREATINDSIPKMTRAEFQALAGRTHYNFGHAVFDFIEERYGKEGMRQFLYTFRKNLVGGADDVYFQAFRLTPDEFDREFDRYLKERFKPYRNKQRAPDYGAPLSPDSTRTSYTQVFAFAPSPSGEIAAAMTGNRADGEADVVLLSLRTGKVIKNLTAGYTGAWDSLHVGFLRRSLSFSPDGERIAFFARAGKRRSLFLASALNGDIQKRIPMEVDQATAPVLLPNGREALFTGIDTGITDIYKLDLETGKAENLTRDSFADADPQVSPDGRYVVHSRRISGFEKLYIFPLDDPSRKTQLTFGTFDDITPVFSDDGNHVYYSSAEDDEIFNLRSLDLRTGVIEQYTDVLSGNLSPVPIPGPLGDRLGFITYHKGEYLLYAIDLAEPLKEVEQDVLIASDEIIDFQPDVVHQVIPENKRKKRMFEKLFLEGRPPINVGFTSGGDFFGGTQLALADVLNDQSFLFTALSIREFRNYDLSYYNQSKRLQWGASLFDTTSYFFSSPYNLQPGFNREGAFVTSRVTGLSTFASYPLDPYRRLTFSVAALRQRQSFGSDAAEQVVRDAAEQNGLQFFLYNGSIVPLSVRLTQETTHFREFGPLTGSTYSVGVEFAPPVAGLLGRTTFDADLRKYLRLGSTTALLALRGRGFRGTGDNPRISYFGGNMEMRGYPYQSFSGNQGFFVNAELRVPLIHLMATPLGVMGPVRGTAYFGMGGAHYSGEPFSCWSSDPAVSFVNFDPEDPSTFLGDPVDGFHLEDCRASYGFGLQFFFLGYPMHFDWTRLTDLSVVSKNSKFDFWIGFDF